MRRILPIAALVLILGATSALGTIGLISTAGGPAAAQGVQRIVAIVNDEVISAYDLEQRMRLLLSTSKSRPTREMQQRMQAQVLQSIVDERLQLQESDRLGITVDDTEIENAIGFIEEQNKLAEGGLAETLRRGGSGLDALATQLEAQIAWSKVIRQQLRPRVSVGPEEVEAVLARIRANTGRGENLVSEIFLSAEGVAQKENMRQSAIELVAQLRGGSPFSDVARQVSQGLSAPDGGNIGWVEGGELAPEVDTVLAKLDVGQISDPIEVVDGFHILYLRDRRGGSGADVSQINVSLKQIFLNLPEGASADVVAIRMESARSLSANARGCDKFQAIIDDLDSEQSGDLGTIALGDTPETFRAAIASLKIGEVSQPVRSPSGVHVFMVCDRQEPEIEEPDRTSIENNIGQTRLSMLARRYLRDLRRDAVVEYR